MNAHRALVETAAPQAAKGGAAPKKNKGKRKRDRPEAGETSEEASKMRKVAPIGAQPIGALVGGGAQPLSEAPEEAADEVLPEEEAAAVAVTPAAPEALAVAVVASPLLPAEDESHEEAQHAASPAKAMAEHDTSLQAMLAGMLHEGHGEYVLEKAPAKLIALLGGLQQVQLDAAPYVVASYVKQLKMHKLCDVILPLSICTDISDDMLLPIFEHPDAFEILLAAHNVEMPVKVIVRDRRKEKRGMLDAKTTALTSRAERVKLFSYVTRTLVAYDLYMTIHECFDVLPDHYTDNNNKRHYFKSPEAKAIYHTKQLLLRVGMPDDAVLRLIGTKTTPGAVSYIKDNLEAAVKFLRSAASFENDVQEEVKREGWVHAKHYVPEKLNPMELILAVLKSGDVAAVGDKVLAERRKQYAEAKDGPTKQKMKNIRELASLPPPPPPPPSCVAKKKKVNKSASVPPNAIPVQESLYQALHNARPQQMAAEAVIRWLDEIPNELKDFILSGQTREEEEEEEED